MMVILKMIRKKDKELFILKKENGQEISEMDNHMGKVYFIILLDKNIKDTIKMVFYNIDFIIFYLLPIKIVQMIN